MKAQVDEQGSCRKNSQDKKRCCWSCRFLQGPGCFAALAVHPESKERDCCNHSHARKIKYSLQQIDTKHTRYGQLFFSRQQKRPYRLTRPAQQLQRRKSRERHLVDIPETRSPQVLLKYFPTKRPQCITQVN